MGQCFLYGNGGGRQLYYDVVCQMAEPTKKEGRIWVKSSIPMTYFEFSPTWGGAGQGTISVQGVVGGVNPDPTNNIIEVFNTKVAGIRNRLKVAPYHCQQVQGSTGNWVNVDAYVCHSNTWVQFSSTWNGELFDNGNQYEGVTGGWVGNGISSTTVGTNLSLIVANSSPYLTTQNAIDLSGYTKLHMIADGNAGQYSYFGISSNVPSNARPNYIASATFSGGENVLDVSAINSGHISIGATASWGVTINISKVWLT